MSASKELTIDLIAAAITTSPIAIACYYFLRQWLNNLSESKRRAVQDRDRSLYRLLRHNKGRVTLTQYVIESKIPVKEAQVHLAQRAKELNAQCEVTEKGNLVYIFDIES